MVKNNVCVYLAGEDQEISAETNGCDFNPISLRLGGKYDTNTTTIFMTRAQAELIARELLAQLQGDLQAGDDETVSIAQVEIDAGAGPEVRGDWAQITHEIGGEA